MGKMLSAGGGAGVGFAAFLAFALAVTAAMAQGVPSGLEKCVAEKVDARRLACFDAEMARLNGQGAHSGPVAAATTMAAASSPVAASAPVAAPTAAEKFGARGDLAREIEGTDPAHGAGVGALEATVTGIDRRAHGELVVTLDNGQVWQQLTMSQSIRLKVGDPITVKPGALGSYSLSGPQRGSIKVKRIK